MKLYVVLLFIIVCKINILSAKTKNIVIDDVSDFKELKKIFRTKNNVLVVFVSTIKENSNLIKVFKDAANIFHGQGTMILLDCSNSEGKKICKKLKAAPNPYIVKHFKDGEFHKDYDRSNSVTSIVNFMRDPTGELPWEEDPTGMDVYHVPDAVTLGKYLKKETLPVMVLFYAPWCGFCKTLKPEYSAAATELKSEYILAAIDVNRPENSIIRKSYNITGFPTLLYYDNGKMKYTFEGENTKAGIISFMQNPSARPEPKSKESDWSSETNSEIVHLTESNFEPALKDEKSAMVMFYAPWCGHCKRMKPEYERAAEIMKKDNIPGVLAALDATKEGVVATRYGVKGYPSVKYFVHGEFKFDVNFRDSDKIIEFMKVPTEPPPPSIVIPWEDEETYVVHLNDETFKPFIKKKKHVLVMFYAPWCGHCKKAKPEFNRAAEEYKDDPRIELAGVDCTKNSAICTQYEVKGYPTIKYFSYLKVIIDYTGDRTYKDFVAYLSDPNALIEKEKVNSFGEFPGSNYVLILTDYNFEQILQNEEHILVMFYAPWCGHCTSMKPDFSEAAKISAHENSGKFAAMDCTVNMKTQEKFKINGFPAIKYFEKGIFRKDYHGKRTVDALLEFMKNRGIDKDEL